MKASCDAREVLECGCPLPLSQGTGRHKACELPGGGKQADVPKSSTGVPRSADVSGLTRVEAPNPNHYSTESLAAGPRSSYA
jgi:hypothetical protein